MSIRILLRGLAVACVVAALWPIYSSAGTPGAQWIANGSTACERYLTPEFLASVLIKPEGVATKVDANSCHTGEVYITLNVQSVDVFKLELPRIVGVTLISGIGDMAYWNHAGATSAVKGRDRGCDISVLNGPYLAKIHDGELGKKLGEICNELFALP
jgi:hypothetical protein